MNKRSISFGVLALLSAGIFAQEKEQEKKKVEQLDEVVVTDSRFELKRENSGKTVIKITAEELEKNQGKSISEIINAKSGFEINGSRSNAGQNLNSFVRGGNNRQVLVLIDGIQVSDPSNIGAEYDLRLISLDQIESIEIIKGAASTLYGNSAATAVINITTKKASGKKIAATLRTSIGTNRSQEDSDYNIADFSHAATISGTAGKFNYLGGVSTQYTDGLSAVTDPNNERDPFSRVNTNLRFGYRFSERFSLNVYGNYDRFDAAFDNAFPIEDADFNFESRQFRTGLSSEFNYGKGSVTLNAAYNTIERIFESNFPSELEGDSYVIDVFNKYNFNDKFYTIVGLNYIRNSATFSEETDFSIVDPYANFVWVSDFGLTLNAGARLNNHSEYGTNLTYNLNPSYLFKFNGDYLKLFGSFSTSYISPSLTQLFGNFGPNPNLEPEEDRTIEGGAEYSFGDKVRISALYFNRNEENFIDFVIIDFNTFQGEYQNVATEFTVQGAEVELSAKPFDKATFSANYTFTEQKDRVAVRIPKHKANASFGYNFTERTFASVNYQYTGNRIDTDFSTFENVELESFSILDLYFSHQVLENKLKVFANVGNLFDEEYTEIIGFTTRGRNVRIGMLLNL
ncbi:TonB-dependent receptor [Leptobacterium flavescens]|uniref:TonB-dependent receptor n=1 Tax=Leptobacterium flavescens TaxID=472055 RepID=A0A6P0UNS1_9FLAO|nr:TonB-dependent receptor plug domain-containing protein [Leptobacterium flavescens]NER11976.1 TonB-dependent receptor [Leptobacterium flavescens]